MKAYLSSTQEGNPSMSDRGRRGGRPKEPTLVQILDTDNPRRGRPAVQGAAPESGRLRQGSHELIKEMPR